MARKDERRNRKAPAKVDHVHLYKSARDGRARWSIIEIPKHADPRTITRKSTKNIQIYHRCRLAIQSITRSNRHYRGKALVWSDKWRGTYETYTHKYTCMSCEAYAPRGILAAYKLLMKL